MLKLNKDKYKEINLFYLKSSFTSEHITMFTKIINERQCRYIDIINILGNALDSNALSDIILMELFLNKEKKYIKILYERFILYK